MINLDYHKLITQLPTIQHTSLIQHYQETLPDEHLIYIASPYTHGKLYVMQSRRQLCYAIDAYLTSAGFTTHNPIGTTTSKGGDSPADDNWYDIDLRELNKATHMLVLDIPGITKSIGVALEIGFAKGKQLSICRARYPEWEQHINPTDKKNLYDGY